jgi:hypothetical protein
MNAVGFNDKKKPHKGKVSGQRQWHLASWGIVFMIIERLPIGKNLIFW